MASDWKKDEGTAGDFVLTAGKWFGNEQDDRGIRTSQDARFYAVSADMGATFSNEGKTLVLQFSAKHEQKLDCGGRYIKLMPSSLDQKTFSDDSPYAVMFGPDICGSSTKRVHAIFTDKTGKNLLTKKTIPCETDELTHVYTLIVHPNNTYAVLVDNEVRESGDLEDHWDFLPPRGFATRTPPSPRTGTTARVSRTRRTSSPRAGTTFRRPSRTPRRRSRRTGTTRTTAVEAPTVPNPEFKGAWRQKTIENPAYKGAWSAPMIPNPEYVADDAVPAEGPAVRRVRAVAGEVRLHLRQRARHRRRRVRENLRRENLGRVARAEKAMFEAAKKKQQEEDDAEAKRLADEAAESGIDEDEFGDDYDDFETPKDEL